MHHGDLVDNPECSLTPPENGETLAGLAIDRHIANQISLPATPPSGKHMRSGRTAYRVVEMCSKLGSGRL